MDDDERRAKVLRLVELIANQIKTNTRLDQAQLAGLAKIALDNSNRKRTLALYNSIQRHLQGYVEAHEVTQANMTMALVAIVGGLCASSPHARNYAEVFGYMVLDFIDQDDNEERSRDLAQARAEAESIINSLKGGRSQ